MTIILDGGPKDGHAFRVGSCRWFPQTIVFDDAGAYSLYQVRPTTTADAANASGDALYTHRPNLKLVEAEPPKEESVG